MMVATTDGNMSKANFETYFSMTGHSPRRF
jgi:hypothetical protein